MSELANRQLALRWLEYARNDLQAASIILLRDDVAPRTACFLAQQSAEKALKAILVLKELNVVRTRDLDAISEKLPKKESAVFESLDLTWLTEWSVESRYPGDWPEASFEDAKKAVTIAIEVLDVCTSIIYLKQISMTGGIPFAVTLPKAPVSVNADLMTTDEIHAKLKEGYNDIEKGNVQDASAAFQRFRETHV